MSSKSARQAAADPNSSPEQLWALANSPRMRRSVAANPAAPAMLLDRLAGRDDVDDAIRAAVAGNPNTSLPTLLRLAEAFPAAFVANPVLPVLLIESPGFARDLTYAAMLRLLQLAATPKALVRALATFGLSDVREAAALHVTVAGEAGDDWRAAALEQIAPTLVIDDAARYWALPELLREAQVRALFASRRFDLPLAGCPATPPDLLATLAASADARVRTAVARHPATPPEVLAALGGDPFVDVRLAVAQHPATESATLARLARDAERQVRLAAAQHPATDSAALDLLALDSVIEVRTTIAARPDLSDARLELLSADDTLIRQTLAENPALPARWLDQLAADPIPAVRAAVARHPALRREAYRTLMQDAHSEVKIALYASPQIKPQRLPGLARSENAEVRAAVAANPTLPEPLLLAMALAVWLTWAMQRGENEKIALALARNPAATSAVLQALPFSEPVTLAILRHPNVPSAHLNRNLLADLHTWDAAALLIARHPRTTLATLRRLAQSGPEIAAVIVRHPRVRPGQARQMMVALLTNLLLTARHSPGYYAAGRGQLWEEKRQAAFLALVAGIALPSLAALVADPDWVVRLCLAAQPDLPFATLVHLSQDGNCFVRAAARAGLTTSPGGPARRHNEGAAHDASA